MALDGARVALFFEAAGPGPHAQFVAVHCADPMAAGGTRRYYESIDMEDAFHPQTILA